MNARDKSFACFVVCAVQSAFSGRPKLKSCMKKGHLDVQDYVGPSIAFYVCMLYDDSSSTPLFGESNEDCNCWLGGDERQQLAASFRAPEIIGAPNPGNHSDIRRARSIHQAASRSF